MYSYSILFSKTSTSLKKDTAIIEINISNTKKFLITFHLSNFGNLISDTISLEKNIISCHDCTNLSKK